MESAVLMRVSTLLATGVFGEKSVEELRSRVATANAVFQAKLNGQKADSTDGSQTVAEVDVNGKYSRPTDAGPSTGLVSRDYSERLLVLSGSRRITGIPMQFRDKKGQASTQSKNKNVGAGFGLPIVQSYRDMVQRLLGRYLDGLPAATPGTVAAVVLTHELRDNLVRTGIP